jgi:uncharacterized membrane-anchored protein
MKKLSLLPRLICLLTLAVFFAGYNLSIASKEALLEQGTVMLLELRPVDPLSLLQGFYMALNFEAEIDISDELELPKGASAQDRPETGLAIMRAAGGGEYVFARIYNAGEALAENEHLLAFKIVYSNFNSVVHIGGGSFFFEEGYEQLYSRARYAEFRVAENGASVLKQLCDQNKNVIAILPQGESTSP